MWCWLVPTNNFFVAHNSFRWDRKNYHTQIFFITCNGFSVVETVVFWVFHSFFPAMQKNIHNISKMPVTLWKRCRSIVEVSHLGVFVPPSSWLCIMVGFPTPWHFCATLVLIFFVYFYAHLDALVKRCTYIF